MIIKSYEHDYGTFLKNPNTFDSSPKARDRPIFTCKALSLTLMPLVNSKPHWRFVVSDVDYYSEYAVVVNVDVFEDDELLGSVGVYQRGKGLKLKVSNKRVDAKRQKGNGYYTDDPEKARLCVRKNFFPLDATERLAKAVSAADSLLCMEMNSKTSNKNVALSRTLGDANEFTKLHMTQYLAEYPRRQPLHNEYIECCEQAVVVDNVKKMFDNGSATTVVLTDSKYIVRTAGVMSMLTDDELTFDMKKKIGLLKLVQDKQMISGVGCRVDKSIFVLLPEEKEQQ